MINLSKNAGFDLARRRRAEIRFRLSSLLAIVTSILFLAFIMTTILSDSTGSARLVQIAVTVNLGTDSIDPADIDSTSFGGLLKKILRMEFPDVKSRADKKKLYNLVSSEGGFEIERQLKADPDLLGGSHEF